MPGVPCPTCDGRGCAACDGSGQLMITGCPLEMIAPDAHAAILAADLANKGSWPVAGGWLDQTRSCVEACVTIWAAESRAERQRRSNADAR